MKILHIITGLGAGGAERVATDLAVAQAERGHDVRVASMLGAGYFSEVLDDAGIRVQDLGFRRSALPRTDALRGLRSMREFAPDVVHTSMLHANIAGRLGRLLTPTRLLVSTIQNIDERGDSARPTWRLRAREQSYRLTDRLADLTSQVSQPGAAHYVERHLVSADRICFVPNATNTSRFRPDEAEREAGRRELEVGADEHLFVNIGSLHPQKAQVDMVHAFADAFTNGLDGPRPRLVVAGDGPLRPELDSCVAARGLSGSVLLVGVRRDIVRLLNAADTFLLPSAFEGMPLALLEAMACAKPSICSDVGANPLLVADGETGRIIPARDRDALVDALRSMASMSPAKRARMGARARDRIERDFSVRAMADSWLAFYERASEGRSRSRRSRPAASIAREIWTPAHGDG